MASEHRGDIQGLRAVAVLVVIAAHAGVPFLRGGFVGVDVFYVISGFLISGLLYREVERNGRLSLATFWARRARRILPAATAVTLATVLVSLVALSFIDARQVAVDALWAAAFAANVHFAQQGVSYFAQENGPSPLQHYWSLAVEEQFYLAWPLLVLLCLLLARLVRDAGGPRGYTGPRLPRGTLAAVLVAITLASFAWSVHATAASPQTAYFSTFTRAWEIGLGALVALVPTARARRMSARTASLLSAVGVTAIVAASVLYSDQVPFPGWAAVLPVAGTVMLLVAGSSGVLTGAARLLSSRVLATVGDWSYSLYLWHWPVLVLTASAFGRELGLLERALAVLLVFGLAALTYEYVEMPFRRGQPARGLRQHRALLLYPVSLVMVAVLAGTSWLYTGVRGGGGEGPPIVVAADADPSPEALVQASVEAARQDAAVPSDLDPDVLDVRESIADVGACDYTEDVRRLCLRGDPDGDRTVVLYGDSHARAWIPAFDEIAEEHGWKAYYLVKPQCVAAHVMVATAGDSQPFTDCARFQRWAIEQVEALSPDLVVVASSPPVNGVLEDGRRVNTINGMVPLLREGYQDLFSKLEPAAGEVVLMRDVPKSTEDPAACLTSGGANLGTCMFTPDERSQQLGSVAVLAALQAGARVVDPTPWLCWQGECPVVIGGTLSYRDADHITTEYAATLADSLGRELGMTGAPATGSGASTS